MKNGNHGLDSFTWRGIKNVLHFFQTGNYIVSDGRCGDGCCGSKSTETAGIIDSKKFELSPIPIGDKA